MACPRTCANTHLGKQARATAGQLHEYLIQTLNRKIWVQPRIAWAGMESLELEKPEVFVWFKDNLLDETLRLRNCVPHLSVDELAEVSGVLRGLCSAL